MDAPSMKSLLRQHWDLARHLRGLEIQLDVEKCKGVWQCYQVCPVGCWDPNYQARKVVLHHSERCIACSACVIQCPEDAIELK